MAPPRSVFVVPPISIVTANGVAEKFSWMGRVRSDSYPSCCYAPLLLRAGALELENLGAVTVAFGEHQPLPRYEAVAGEVADGRLVELLVSFGPFVARGTVVEPSTKPWSWVKWPTSTLFSVVSCTWVAIRYRFQRIGVRPRDL